MIATLFAYALLALAALAALSIALLPLTLLSGWWAHRQAARHLAEADRIEHLLAR